MDVFLSILAIIWSILCLILFFKIWAMTNNVQEIRDFIIDGKKPEEIKKPEEKIIKKKETFEYTPGQYGKFKVGDVVYTDAHKGALVIIDCYDDKTYNCEDASTNELIGVFKENELKEK